MSAIEPISGQNFRFKWRKFGKKKIGSEPVWSSYRIQFGGGDPKLCEPEPLTSKVTIAALWKREQLDLAELARLRWVEKWSNQRLAEYFGVSPTKAKNSLRRIKADPRLAGLGETPPVIRGRP